MMMMMVVMMMMILSLFNERVRVRADIPPMSRPTEAIATTAASNNYSGAVFGSAPRVSKRIPHSKPHRGTTNGAVTATGRGVAA